MRAFQVLLLAAAVSALPGVARADFMFSPTNSPSGDEQNIMFEQQVTGQALFVGDTNQTNTPIIFDDTVPGARLPEATIGTDGKGQADIVCTSGCNPTSQGGANGHQLTDVEIKLAPGFGATDFVGNLDFGEGTADINVVDQMGQSFDYVLGNGQNFFTIAAVAGEVITDIQIEQETGATDNFGFNDLKQPRISGICTLKGATCTAVPVPEPASISLLGAGVLLAGWLFRRKGHLSSRAVTAG